MRTADQLAAEVQGLAITLTNHEREQVPGAAESVEAEITRLEAEANPLDERASDGRVRRLAQLKRERRALHDAGKRFERDRGRLEACVLGLQNLRYDLLRLKNGQMAPQQVTQLVERAMSLSSDVDGLVLAEELARGGSTRESPRRSGV
jgi:serine/threonine-protein kinase